MRTVTAKLLAAILLVFIVLTVVNIASKMMEEEHDVETAKLYSTSQKISFEGVYIRDEAVLRYNANGVISYAVPDGGKVAKGSAVAEIYEDEAQIEIKQKIQTLSEELEILKRIQKRGSTEVGKPARLSEQIEDEYRSLVYNKERLDLLSLSKNKENLLILLSTMKIITNESDDFTDRISTLESDINALEAGKQAPVETIYSDKSAYFVSYADDYENVFTTESVNTITAEDIRGVKENTVSTDPGVVGKTISGYKWYIAGIIPDYTSTFKVGDAVRLSLDSSAKNITGVIEDMRKTENENEYIVILSCDELTYELVQYRVETVRMSQLVTYEGLQIPRKAITFSEITEKVKDAETGEEVERTVRYEGVYVKLGEKISFKKLDVVYRADDFVLSKVTNDNSYVAIYDDIILEDMSANEN